MIPNGPWCYGLSLPPRFTWSVNACQGRRGRSGGPWRDGPRDDGRPHGFDVVAAIAGAGNWGIDGDDRGRVAWARFGR